MVSPHESVGNVLPPALLRWKTPFGGLFCRYHNYNNYCHRAFFDFSETDLFNPSLFLGFPNFQRGCCFYHIQDWLFGLDQTAIFQSNTIISTTKTWILFSIYFWKLWMRRELIYYLFVAVGNLIIIFFWLSSSRGDTFRKKRLIIIVFSSDFQNDNFLHRANTSVFVYICKAEILKSKPPSLHSNLCQSLRLIQR